MTIFTGYEIYLDSDVVDREYNQHGQATIGYHHVAENVFYKAVRYTAEQYRLRCFSSPHELPNQFRNSYHSSRDLSVRGSIPDRDRFSRDLHDYVLELPTEEYERVLRLLKKGKDCDDLHGISRELAFGLRYSQTDLDNGRGGLARYMRGFYFQAAHSQTGIVIGRFGWKDSGTMSGAVSTPHQPILDRYIIENFGQTTTPEEEIREEQRGILALPFEVEDASTPLWTLPTNDSFVLGAIHFGRDIHLATPRKPSCLFRHRVGGQMTTFGREVAVALSSGAYELHCSRILGETLKFVGAPTDAQYNVRELMDAVHQVYGNGRLQSLLSWLYSAKEDLSPGEVIVISREALSIYGRQGDFKQGIESACYAHNAKGDEVESRDIRFDEAVGDAQVV